MKKSANKLISRGLDGEVTVDERVNLDVMMKTENEAEKTSQEWAKLGDHLRASSSRIPVPDSLAAWRDIHREIRLIEETPEETGTFGARFGWAVGLAGLVVMGLLGYSAWKVVYPSPSALAVHAAPGSRVVWVKAEIPGSTTMIYTDTETDLTVIWLDVAQSVDPRDS